MKLYIINKITKYWKKLYKMNEIKMYVTIEVICIKSMLFDCKRGLNDSHKIKKHNTCMKLIHSSEQ